MQGVGSMKEVGAARAVAKASEGAGWARVALPRAKAFPPLTRDATLDQPRRRYESGRGRSRMRRQPDEMSRDLCRWPPPKASQIARRAALSLPPGPWHPVNSGSAASDDTAETPNEDQHPKGAPTARAACRGDA